MDFFLSHSNLIAQLSGFEPRLLCFALLLAARQPLRLTTSEILKKFSHLIQFVLKIVQVAFSVTSAGTHKLMGPHNVSTVSRGAVAQSVEHPKGPCQVQLY